MDKAIADKYAPIIQSKKDQMIDHFAYLKNFGYRKARVQILIHN